MIQHFAFRNPKSAFVFGAALVVAAVLCFAAVAQACPTCAEGIASADPHHQSIAAGYYYSILFMMSMPFAILGTFCGLAYVSIRRAREQELCDDVACDVEAGDPSGRG